MGLLDKIDAGLDRLSSKFTFAPSDIKKRTPENKVKTQFTNILAIAMTGIFLTIAIYFFSPALALAVAVLTFFCMAYAYHKCNKSFKESKVDLNVPINDNSHVNPPGQEPTENPRELLFAKYKFPLETKGLKDVDEVKKAITNPANEMLCAKFIQHLSEYNTDKNPIPEWIQGDSSDVKEKLGKMSSDEWKELQTYINNTPPLAAEMYMIDASMQENLNEIICIKEEGKDPVYVDINGIVDDDRKNAMEGKETKVINCKRNSEGKMEYVSEKRSTPEIQPSNANPISSDERPPSVQQKKAEKPKGNMTEEQEKAFKKNPFLYSCTKGSARRAMIEGKGDISPLKGFANDIKGAGKWIGSKWSNLKNKITGGTDEPPAE